MLINDSHDSWSDQQETKVLVLFFPGEIDPYKPSSSLDWHFEWYFYLSAFVYMLLQSNI